MVECQLPKLDVAGSNPVSRSNSQYTSPFSMTTNIRALSWLLEPWPVALVSAARRRRLPIERRSFSR